MRAYSTDLRGRVLAACEGGLGAAEAAETLAVSASWARRVKRRFRDKGEVAPRVPARRGPAPALAGRDDRTRQGARGSPGLTAAEHRDRLGLKVSVVTAWRAPRRLGRTHKTSPSGRPCSAARTGTRSGPSGSPGGRPSTRPGRGSSATRGPRRTWPGPTGPRPGGSGWSTPPRTAAGTRPPSSGP